MKQSAPVKVEFHFPTTKQAQELLAERLAQLQGEWLTGQLERMEQEKKKEELIQGMLKLLEEKKA